jgi:hypothetical protein
MEVYFPIVPLKNKIMCYLHVNTSSSVWLLKLVLMFVTLVGIPLIAYQNRFFIFYAWWRDLFVLWCVCVHACARQLLVTCSQLIYTIKNKAT